MLSASDTIKELIKMKKITQVELAEKLGMSKQNINNKFKRNTFSPDEVVKKIYFLIGTVSQRIY